MPRRFLTRKDWSPRPRKRRAKTIKLRQQGGLLLDGIGVDESNQIVGGPLVSSGRLPHADKYANPHISLAEFMADKGQSGNASSPSMICGRTPAFDASIRTPEQRGAWTERRTHDDEFEGQCRHPFPHHGTDPHGFR
jgi:hypothetical protein